MSRLHLAGIIPIANLKTDFDLLIPEVLLPLAAGFSAIQKSVFECAMAGCNTIWIIANDDLAPVIREAVGDWVYDPVYYHSPAKFSSEQRKEIPIYYVPIHPKDRDRRDSYGAEKYRIQRRTFSSLTTKAILKIIYQFHLQ